MFKEKTTKILLISGILGVLVILTSIVIQDKNNVVTNQEYKLTAQAVDYVPITGRDEGSLFGGTGDISLGAFVEKAFDWGVAITVILAFLFIVLGSVQYMTTDAVFDKKEGLQKIQAAIAGLILALVSWLILNTINPNLIKTDILTPNISTTGTGRITVTRDTSGDEVSTPNVTSAMNPTEVNIDGINNTNLPANAVEANINNTGVNDWSNLPDGTTDPGTRYYNTTNGQVNTPPDPGQTINFDNFSFN